MLYRQAKKTVVFIQGFGTKNYFKTLSNKEFMGWKRNIAILINILNKKRIHWIECYSKDLRDINFYADLYIIRDWRYKKEDIQFFMNKNKNVPVISLLFNVPQYFLNQQIKGELKYLFNHQDINSLNADNETDTNLFLTNKVIVRSKLNLQLFSELGYPSEKMVYLPHSPFCSFSSKPKAIDLYSMHSANSSLFNICFIGEHIIRKGLIRMIRIMKELTQENIRLHIFNSALYNYKKGIHKEIPDYMQKDFNTAIESSNIIIHKAYSTISEYTEICKQMNLFICPSLFDNGPNSLIEAWQTGVPVIASDLCGAINDIPDNSIQVIKAPKWWRNNQAADFNADIKSQILKNIQIQVTNSKPEPDVIINQIVNIWIDLLDIYSL